MRDFTFTVVFPSWVPPLLRLLEMVHDCFGKIAKASVDEVTPEQLPAILLVYKMKGSLDIRNIIQGNHDMR